MLKKTILIAGMAILVAGCGSSSSGSGYSTYVKPNATKSTGDLDKLWSIITGVYDGTTTSMGDTNDTLDKLSKISLRDLGFEPRYRRLGAIHMNLESITDKETKPKCIKDDIDYEEDKNKGGKAKGTFVFNDCNFSGLDINGSIFIDYTVKQTSRKETIKLYVEINDLTINNQEYNNTIVADIIKFKFNSMASSDGHGGSRSSSSSIGLGARAYIEDKGKKVVLLDGLNGGFDYRSDSDKSSYSFAIDGYIGNDDNGIYRYDTTNKITKKEQDKCPKGELAIFGKDDDNITIAVSDEGIVSSYKDESKTYDICNNQK